MDIEQRHLIKNTLSGKVILLTGAGGGIGLETAKILNYMGAYLIIAEIDKKRIKNAKKHLSENTEFFNIDLSSIKNISKMVRKIVKKHGFIDMLFNNAIIANIGKVEDLNIKIWEKSYAVNFRAPLFLTQKVLPLMKKRNSGTIIFVSSSGSAPYMGAYEIFKMAQVELANTLNGELEGTEVNVFTISPGLVKTETAEKGIKLLAENMNITLDEFYKMNEGHIIDVEEAGKGFALSALKAKEYNGQEIGVIQVLNEFGVITSKNVKQLDINNNEIIESIIFIIQEYRNQYKGWTERNIFERQWVLRDFKKTTSYSAENCLEIINNIHQNIKNNNFNEIINNNNIFIKLKLYFERQYKLLQGFEKDPLKLKEYSDYLTKLVNELGKIIIGIKN